MRHRLTKIVKLLVTALADPGRAAELRNYEDLGKPCTDNSSPNFPAGAANPRPIDNATCLDLPVEGNHVLGISSLGPSTGKADYSSYGVEQEELTG